MEVIKIVFFSLCPIIFIYVLYFIGLKLSFFSLFINSLKLSYFKLILILILFLFEILLQVIWKLHQLGVLSHYQIDLGFLKLQFILWSLQLLCCTWSLRRGIPLVFYWIHICSGSFFKRTIRTTIAEIIFSFWKNRLFRLRSLWNFERTMTRLDERIWSIQ